MATSDAFRVRAVGFESLHLLAGDVVYYGGGLSTALLMSAQPATRAARLPVLVILLANWGTEHWLLHFLRPYLEVDASGEVFAAVPQPRLLWGARSLLQHYRGRAALGSGHQVSYTAKVVGSLEVFFS